MTNRENAHDAMVMEGADPEAGRGRPESLGESEAQNLPRRGFPCRSIAGRELVMQNMNAFTASVPQRSISPSRPPGTPRPG